jgi:hypothetical protein
MSTNLQRDPDKVFRTSCVSFRTSPSRPVNIEASMKQAVHDLHADHLLGAARAIQESIEEAFGKNSHDIQLED